MNDKLFIIKKIVLSHFPIDFFIIMIVTHNMKDAIAHGNRLIMMYDGKIVIDVQGEDKKKLTFPQLLELFSKVSGSDEADDKLLLS